MNYSDLFITMARRVDSTSPSLFPFPFGMHLTFAIIGLLFFAFRFYTQKRPFQLIMAIAIPISLILWFSDSRTLFYGLGIVELILMSAALITSFIFKAPAEGADDRKIEDVEVDDSDTDDSDDDGGDDEEDEA